MSEAASYDHLVPEVILKLNNKIRQVPSLTSEVLSGTWLDQGEKDLVAGDPPPLPPHHRDPQLPRRAQGAEGVRSSCQRLHEDLQWGRDQQRLTCLNSLGTTHFQALSFEKRKSTPENILEAVEMLKVTKQRHSVVVPNMARACRAMRQKYQLGMEEVGPTKLSN